MTLSESWDSPFPFEMWEFLFPVPLRFQHHVLQPLTCALFNTWQASYTIFKAEHTVIWSLSKKFNIGPRASFQTGPPPFPADTEEHLLPLKSARCRLHTADFHLSAMKGDSHTTKEHPWSSAVRIQSFCHPHFWETRQTLRLWTLKSKWSEWFLTAVKGCFSCNHQQSQFREQKEIEQH